MCRGLFYSQDMKFEVEKQIRVKGARKANELKIAILTFTNDFHTNVFAELILGCSWKYLSPVCVTVLIKFISGRKME